MIQTISEPQYRCLSNLRKKSKQSENLKMGIYFTKTQLYNQIDDIRLRLGISASDYPLEFRAIAESIPNLSIGEMIIRTPGLRAMASASRNENLENDAIILKMGSEQREQNFYCAHEYLHLVFHRNKQRNFSCYDKIQKQQNPFYEWHANEGAAELLVPYKLFIPEFYRLSEKYRDYDFPQYTTIEKLSILFNVTEAVIENRISNLNQELYQYRHQHMGLESIHLISQHQAEREVLPRRATHLLYCRKCYSLLDEKYEYCPICGEQIIGDNFIKWKLYDTKRAKGAGYMKYKEYATDEDGKLTECLVCNNSSFPENAGYCHICGKPVRNKCAGEDFNGNICSCEEADINGIPSNARFCPYCGSETSFNKANILPDWSKEKEDYEAKILSDFTPLDDAVLPDLPDKSSATSDFMSLPEADLPF